MDINILISLYVSSETLTIANVLPAVLLFLHSESIPQVYFYLVPLREMLDLNRNLPVHTCTRARAHTHTNTHKSSHTHTQDHTYTHPLPTHVSTTNIRTQRCTCTRHIHACTHENGKKK